jgi:uncharacterized protein YdaU (DUF1376 family)
VHYYKKNIGDYAKKAGRLTMLQHGAYTLLLDSCYDRERFPTLQEAIEWAWASTEAEVEAVKFVLSRFFTLDKDGCYVQDRILQELLEYHAKSDTNKRIAIERETKRKEKSTNRGQSVNEPPPNQEPITINQEPINLGTNVPSPPKAERKKLPGCAHQKVLDLYHQHLPTLRRVEVWNDARQAMLRSRWREVAAEMAEEKEVDEEQVLTWWEEFFQHISRSKFLTGKVSGKDGRAFAADLEWIVRPTNFVKIVEGKYHGVS